MIAQFTKGSAISSIGGIPTLMANGRPLPAPVFCLMHEQAMQDDVVASLYRNGIGAFATRSMMGVGDCHQTDTTIELAVKRLANVARVAPKALLMADCDFFPSEEWMIGHPEEGFITSDHRILVLGQDGMSDRRDYIQVPGPSIKDVKGRTLHGEDVRSIYGRRRLSPFSELFAQETRNTMQKFLAAMKANGLDRRLVGVFVGCYIFGEWNLYMIAPDHGQVSVQKFRGYLERKYAGDQTLQAAWGDPFVTLHDALPPREYAHTDLPPMKLGTQRHADYQSAEANALSEQFSIIARDIKSLSPHLLVGGFFPGANPPQSNWLRLVKEPSVDFLATPLAYENRGPGNGVGSQSPFCDGFSHLGKVWFDELDTRTLIARKETHYPYGRAKTIRESVELLWRDAGQMLVRGHHGWWLDFNNDGIAPFSWHLEPEILRFHKQFSGIWQGIAGLDRRPLGEIKVFIPSNAARHHQILYHADCQRHTEWTFLGAPVECDVLENLLEGRSKPGKLNVIHGAGCLSSDVLRHLARCFNGSGSFVVWMGGAGLFEDGRPVDAQRMDGVIPIQQHFSLLYEPQEAEAISTPESSMFLGLREKLLVGQYARKLTSGFVSSPKDLNVPMKRISISWKLEVTDSDATPLARLTSDNSVVAAMKKDASGTTHVAYNLPVLNTVFFRSLAQKASCHLFTHRDDVIYASKGLVLLHAAYSGIHRLFFPEGASVLDLRQNSHVDLNGQLLPLKLKRGETRLFRFSV
jgi:hypothetical protein